MNLSIKYFNLFLFAAFILLFPLFNNCDNDAVVNSNNDSTDTPIEEPTDTNNYDPCNIDPLPVGVWQGPNGKIVAATYMLDNTETPFSLIKFELNKNDTTILVKTNDYLGSFEGEEYFSNQPILPRWHPSGTKIAYVDFYTSKMPIVVMNENGENKKIIGLGHYGFASEGIKSLEWSPDGSRLLFIQDSDLHIVDTLGNLCENVVPSQITYNQKVYLVKKTGCKWYDNKNFLIWMRRDTTIITSGYLYKFSLDSLKITGPLTECEIAGYNFYYSPDMALAAFEKGSYQIDEHINLLHLDNCDSYEVTFGTSDLSPRWGNANNIVLFSRDENELNGDQCLYLYAVEVDNGLRITKLSSLNISEGELFVIE